MKAFLYAFVALTILPALGHDKLGEVQKKIDLAARNVRVAEARLEYLKSHNLAPASLMEEVLETREYTAMALMILSRTHLTQMDDERSGNRMAHFRRARVSLYKRASTVEVALGAFLAKQPIVKARGEELDPEPVLVPEATPVTTLVAPEEEENDEIIVEVEDAQAQDEDAEEAEEADLTSEVAQ